MTMTSPKSYLLRAFYDWIVDNGLTPYVLVDAGAQDVDVPREFVQDGKIVLNIAPSAVQALIMDTQQVSFSARFRGSPRNIYVPMAALKAVYAKENGRGMVFPEEEGDTVTPPPTPPQGPPKGVTPRKGPALKVVK